MSLPTSRERLEELKGLIEEGTTGGTLDLSIDDIGYLYAWLAWIGGTLDGLNSVRAEVGKGQDPSITYDRLSAIL